MFDERAHPDAGGADVRTWPYSWCQSRRPLAFTPVSPVRVASIFQHDRPCVGVWTASTAAVFARRAGSPVMPPVRGPNALRGMNGAS
jgi:hypothetical protein